jgi:hypothetical protein
MFIAVTALTFAIICLFVAFVSFDASFIGIGSFDPDAPEFFQPDHIWLVARISSVIFGLSVTFAHFDPPKPQGPEGEGMAPA